MPDSRFFENLGPVTVAELASLTGAERVGDAAGVIEMVAPLDRAETNAVSFFADRRYRADLASTRAGACFVSAADAEIAPEGCIRLVTAEPKLAYARAAARLHKPRLSVGAEFVHPTAILEEGVVLAPGVVVGPDAKIGAGTQVGANTAVGPGVAIGRECVIGANVTIGFALIGDRVRIYAGAVIGEAGFGVEPSRGGAFDMPQLGRVILQDGVTVGANTCIDRGALEDTVVGENTKIDNQVQIGHNVHLGRSCVLCGHVGLSGVDNRRRRCAVRRQGRRGRPRHDWRRSPGGRRLGRYARHSGGRGLGRDAGGSRAAVLAPGRLAQPHGQPEDGGG